MKHLIYIFLIIPFVVSGQIEYNFESGYPDTWQQSLPGRWNVTENEPIYGSRSLQHIYDNAQSGSDFIFLSLDYTDPADTLVYEFSIRHGYAPSSLNNWQLVLLADQVDQSNNCIPLNGILFGVNYADADDLLKILQITGDRIYTICNSGFNYQERVGVDNKVKFRIIRFPDGIWEISFLLNDEAEASRFEAIARGEELFFSNNRIFGFRYSYSASQDRQLWIDNVKIDGTFNKDTISPFIEQSIVKGLRQVDIIFSEPVSEHSRFNYSWEGMFPDSLSTKGESTSLFFSKRFPNRIGQSLKVNRIKDLSGNQMQDTVIAFWQSLAEFGDIVISEILYDTDPRVYLPDCEYVEICNRYDSVIQLKGWKLIVNEREYTLPEGDILPGEYLVLTSLNPECNGSFSPSLPVFHHQTALPNSGGEIKLYDPFYMLVHTAVYQPSDYYDEMKGAGGWSLERSDLDYLCGGQPNWSFSEDAAGGTPGKQNSVTRQIDDTRPPSVSSFGISDTNSIVLDFHEPVFMEDDKSASFSIEGIPMSLEYEKWPFAGSSIVLERDIAFEEGINYNLITEGVEDCSGNIMGRAELTFSLPEIPEKGQVQINEIMYDPLSGGDEYFELYNQGPGWVDLEDISFGVSGIGSNDLSRRFISDQSIIVGPGAYVVICRNSKSLISQWSLPDENGILQAENWISLPNGGSCIYIYDRAGRMIDAICYSDSMHNDLLASTQGISLERISTSECAVKSQCWTSASSSSGYGTPGERNSQWQQEEEERDAFRLSQKIVSPDNDGYDDILKIYLPSGMEDVLVDIFITDLGGFTIRQIVSGGIPGSNDLYSWDGKDQSGNIVIPGIYIVHCRYRGFAGINTERIPCAVIYQ